MGKPEIRFKGYTDEWEQRKFSEGVSEIGDGLHGTPIYCEDGNVYFINGNNLVDGKIVINAETKKVNESQQSTADKSLDDTTILMSINGTIGNLAYYSGERLMLGKSAAYIKVSEFDKRFVYAYLQAPSVHGYFMDSLTGTTIKNLGLKAIREMIMFIPQDVDEQKRIGKFLDQLDHLITLHQRKCDEVKSLKKYMLQKMFPQNEQKVPEIRFEGFTEAWEQRKLEDLTEELSDYATMASGLPLLTSSRSGLMYQSDFRDRKTTTSDETLFSIVPKGSCTYRHMSDDDIFHLNINVLEKGLVSREYPVFISSENNDLEFIIQHINSSNRFRTFCKGQKKGGTRTRLYYKTLCEFEMMIPSIEEQKKISAILHNLDHLITLHQQKCEELKKIKKFMLQKMFV